VCGTQNLLVRICFFKKLLLFFLSFIFLPFNNNKRRSSNNQQAISKRGNPQMLPERPINLIDKERPAVERPVESQVSIHHQIKNFEFNFFVAKTQTYHALDELDEVALNQMHGAGYLEMPGTGEAG
jgi:hypothetical protein